MVAPQLGLRQVERRLRAQRDVLLTAARDEPRFQQAPGLSEQAAAILGDTTALRAMLEDLDDNVAETAIEALASRTGHADDARYLAALRRDGAHETLNGITHRRDSSHAERAFARGGTADQNDTAVGAQVFGTEAHRVYITPELAKRALEAVEIHA